MAGSGRWPRPPGSARPRCRWALVSWIPGRSRWAGRAGRAAAASRPPIWIRGLRPALLALVEPEERGDPMSPLRWTTRPTRNLAAELTRQGHLGELVPAWIR